MSHEQGHGIEEDVHEYIIRSERCDHICFTFDQLISVYVCVSSFILFELGDFLIS